MQGAGLTHVERRSADQSTRRESQAEVLAASVMTGAWRLCASLSLKLLSLKLVGLRVRLIVG